MKTLAHDDIKKGQTVTIFRNAPVMMQTIDASEEGFPKPGLKPVYLNKEQVGEVFVVEAVDLPFVILKTLQPTQFGLIPALQCIDLRDVILAETTRQYALARWGNKNLSCLKKFSVTKADKEREAMAKKAPPLSLATFLSSFVGEPLPPSVSAETPVQPKVEEKALEAAPVTVGRKRKPKAKKADKKDDVSQ